MDKQTSAPAVGASSLLVIFAVLCLTVFALLSLSTVQADKRLSDAGAGAVSAYYEADCEAERIFSLLRSGELPDGVIVSGDTYYFTCPVSDTLSLEVELICSEDAWTVLRWQTTVTTDWEADDSIEIWDGDGIF